MCATADGRVFVTCDDSCIYELDYQTEGGWFNSKCRKINLSASIISSFIPSFFKKSVPLSLGFPLLSMKHSIADHVPCVILIHVINKRSSDKDPITMLRVDDSRNLLYALRSSSVTAYFLGSDGTQFETLNTLDFNLTPNLNKVFHLDLFSFLALSSS